MGLFNKFICKYKEEDFNEEKWETASNRFSSVILFIFLLMTLKRIMTEQTPLQKIKQFSIGSRNSKIGEFSTKRKGLKVIIFHLVHPMKIPTHQVIVRMKIKTIFNKFYDFMILKF